MKTLHLLTTLLLPVAAQAATVTVDFDSYVHGTQISPNTTSIEIYGYDDDDGTSPLPLAIYSTLADGEDPDLEKPHAGGNALNYDFDNVLIVQENNMMNSLGLFTSPDDRAAGGHVEFLFEAASFQFVFADSETQLSLLVKDSVGASVTYTTNFTDIGDNYVNQTDNITATSLGLQDIAGVTVQYNNTSGAIAALSYETIPEPSSALLGLLGLSAFLFRRVRG